MAKKISPAPISTPISDNANLTLPWSTWLRESSNFLVDATKTVTANDVQYAMIGTLCFISVNSTFTNGKIKLPYTALVSKKIQAFIGGANTPVYFDLNAGDSELAVTAHVQVVISDWFMAQLG